MNELHEYDNYHAPVAGTFLCSVCAVPSSSSQHERSTLCAASVSLSGNYYREKVGSLNRKRTMMLAGKRMRERGANFGKKWASLTTALPMLLPVTLSSTATVIFSFSRCETVKKVVTFHYRWRVRKESAGQIGEQVRLGS